VADYKAVPFVPMEAIPQGGQYEPRYDQKPGADITSGTYFERGDLLIAKITPSFENGKQAWVKRLPAPFGYATTEVIPLRPTAAGYDRRLLFFYLLHPEIRSYVSERMEGSTGRQRVPEQVLLDLPYPKLPPDDQQAIADTLERVTLQVDLEEHSARTAAELKRAAMRELFTRGLRGEPQKETEIGPVPESWEIRNFSEAAVLQRGFDLPVSARRAGDVVVFGSNGPVGTHDAVPPGVSTPTVMVGRSGSVGKVSYCDQRCWPLNTTLFVSDFRGNNPKYVYFWLEHFDLTRFGQGVSVPTLNRNTFASVKVAVPTQDEQREIVAILDAIDRKIELHRKKRAVLEELFKALLHKLMTGEIRVDALDLSALQRYEGLVSRAAEAAV